MDIPSEIDWEMIVKSTLLGQGCSWFRDRNEPEANDCTAPEPAAGLGFEIYEWTKTWKYSKYFICGIGKQGERFFPKYSSSQFPATKALTFRNSVLGSRILESFKRIGIGGDFYSFGEPDSMFLGTWKNAYEMPFVQWGEIYGAEDGSEVLKWSTDLFFYSVDLIEEDPRAWSIHIPALIENMLYLSEANLKQSMLTLPREGSWDDLSIDKIPHPVLRFQANDAAIVARPSENGTLIRSVPCRTVVNVAYDISDILSDSELDLVLGKVCDTFIELSTASLTCFIQAIELENLNYLDVFGCDVGQILPLASHLPENLEAGN
jgi:hypothetical protein